MKNEVAIDVEVESIKIFARKDGIKGGADILLKDWNIKICKLSWKFDKDNKLRVKLPGLKHGVKKEKFLPLLCFENKDLEKAIKKSTKKAVKAFLSEKNP